MQATDASAHTSPAQLAGELLALWHHLIGGASAQFEVFERLDLSLTQVKTLQVLATAQADLSVKELSERLGLSLPGASRGAEMLLRRGLLERREDEHDRRIKRVRLTAAGHQAVNDIDGARTARLHEFARELTPEQRARLSAALRDLPHTT